MKFRDNYVLVTSRPTGLEQTPFSNHIDEIERERQIPLLNLYFIDSFNDEQIDIFSQKWFK